MFRFEFEAFRGFPLELVHQILDYILLLFKFIHYLEHRLLHLLDVLLVLLFKPRDGLVLGAPCAVRTSLLDRLLRGVVWVLDPQWGKVGADVGCFILFKDL